MNIVEGNILHSDREIVVQQVNCRGEMGSGIARQIMDRYENVKEEYIKYRKKQLKKGLTDEDLLGHVHFVDTYDEKIIANVFGQVDIRKGPEDTAVYTKVEALLKGITIIRDKAEQLGLSVGIPTYIGCGAANGDWEEVREGIEEIFKDSTVDVQLYHFRPHEIPNK